MKSRFFCSFIHDTKILFLLVGYCHSNERAAVSWNCLNITRQSQTGSKIFDMSIYSCDVLTTKNSDSVLCSLRLHNYKRSLEECSVLFFSEYNRLQPYSLIWNIFIHISGCGHCKAMKPAYMEAAQELHSKNVCIHNTQLEEKLLFQTLLLVILKATAWLERNATTRSKRLLLLTMGEGSGNVSESQVDSSSLSSVMLGWQSTCLGVDNLIIDTEKQARIKCSVQELHGLCSNSKWTPHTCVSVV